MIRQLRGSTQLGSGVQSTLNQSGGGKGGYAGQGGGQQQPQRSLRNFSSMGSDVSAPNIAPPIQFHQIPIIQL